MWEKCRRFAITISTHTPAWSVTFFAACTAFCASISTHTPAWGVTISSTPTEQTVLNFNSHARVGRDPSCTRYTPLSTVFQLTRPRGA